MTHSSTPILVGVGQVLQRIDRQDEFLETSVEPVEMMLDACRQAETDTGVTGLLQQVQSVRVIRGVWRYANPARFVAQNIGAPAAQTVGTLFGGNQVQAVVNRTASSILAGELDLVLITGAENGYSAAKARKAGIDLPQRDTPGSYDLVIGSQKPEHHDLEIAKGIRQAIQVYPMYENAIRYQRGESIEDHLTRVSALWSRFSDVAARNPNAWLRDRFSPEAIRTPSPRNRRISFPYTKLMNSNMAVDMSAALIMCSVAKARQLGIPEKQWVYPHAGVEGYDHFCASVRENFYSSPGIRIVGERVMALAGVSAGKLDHVDLYSCFPAAVQIAADELGLPQTRPLTVTGGLTFGGGPLNNYVMHSIARMTQLLREDRGSRGLITANGGNLYKHAHCVYSSEPPARDFRFDTVHDEIAALPSREVVAEHHGDVTLESYTVMYGGQGAEVAHCACLTPDGSRTWVNVQDPDLMEVMTSEEFCGRSAHIDSAGRLTIR